VFDRERSSSPLPCDLGERLPCMPAQVLQRGIVTWDCKSIVGPAWSIIVGQVRSIDCAVGFVLTTVVDGMGAEDTTKDGDGTAATGGPVFTGRLWCTAVLGGEKASRACRGGNLRLGKTTEEDVGTRGVGAPLRLRPGNWYEVGGEQ